MLKNDIGGEQMKKRIVPFMFAISLLICLFPTAALAVEPTANTADKQQYTAYAAIGDSICAGFAQADYAYCNGFDMMENISNSPKDCYVRLVGRAFGIDSATYNLGKCGCDTNELLDILKNEKNNYNGTYLGYIGASDLITLGIGSNDLLMAVVDSILACAGTTMTHQQAMALVEPLLTGDIDGIVNLIETITGIKLSEDQIKAILEALSDEKLNETLNAAYQKFIANFPLIVDNLNSINKTAEIVILNYYNPFKGRNFSYRDLKYSIGDTIQKFTDDMNSFTAEYCQDQCYPYVDIRDIQTNMDIGTIDPHPSKYGHTQIADRIVDKLTLTVTATAQSGGTITPSGVNVVKEGDSLTFTITPDSGYMISDVLADGVSVGSVSTYKFENITADHTITASFSVDIGTAPVPGTTYYKTYSALGDSITAGYAQKDYNGDFSNPSTCYVAVAAEKLGVKNNSNLGLLGQKSGDLLYVLQNKDAKYHDKFSCDLAASNLITIDIGSNDLTMALLGLVFDYLKVDLSERTPEQRLELILHCINDIKLETLYEDIRTYLSPDITDAQIDGLLNVLKDTSQDSELNKRFSEAYENFTKNWDAIIKEIRSNINPDAAIVALGYYNILPDSFNYNGTEYRISTLSGKYVEMMNSYISKESETADEYIYVSTQGVELIKAGGLIMVDPHPSEKGHTDIANRIVDAVLSKITATGGTGIAVSPEGASIVAYGRTEEYSYTYKFTPAVEDVFVNGESAKAPGGVYIFKEVKGDCTISAAGAVIPTPSIPVPPVAYDSAVYNYYSVTPSASEGGSISPSDKQLVREGTDKTFTITPDSGYEIAYIMLDGKKIDTSNTVTLTNVKAEHSLYVAFKETGSGVIKYKNPFTDVKSTDWFYEAAMYAYSKGLIKGISATTFEPNTATSRAMILAILYQMENKPAVEGNVELSAAITGKWYSNAIMWAAQNGIIKGYGNGEFGPDDKITREQIVTVLYQYAVYKGYKTAALADLSGYTDSSSVSEWARAAMQWAVAEGLINGIGNSSLAPGGTATRAEITVLIYRFIEKFGE